MGQADRELSVGTTPDFDEWVVARGHSLLRLAFVLTGTADAAEDVVEDALSRALPRWSRIWGRRDPEAELRRLVLRAHLSRWRRLRRRHAPAPPPMEQAASTGIAIRVPDTVWDAYRSLPRRERTALVLRFYEGLRDDEIADLTRTREAKVRTCVTGGLSALRTELGDR